MTDKDRQPWSVRGVTGEARARAARAAHRRRMTIGEWVTETILKAAARDLGETSETPQPSAGLPALREGPPQAELAGALGALVQHLQNDRGGGMADVTRRVERTEAILTGRMEQIAAALYAVMQTVERKSMTVVEHDDGREAAIAAEQARLAEQVARLAGQEHRRQDQMAAIAEALTLLAGKVDAGQQAHAAPPPVQPQPEPQAQPEPQPAAVSPAAADMASAPAADTMVFEPRAAAQPRPRHSVHHDPRAEEIAAEICIAARQPPEMPDEGDGYAYGADDRRSRRRGLLGRLLRRD